jgi:hypothetical protein
MIISWIIFMMVEGAKNKALTVLGGIVASFITLLFVAAMNEKTVSYSSSSYTSAPEKKASTAEVKLQNYKKQGDSVNLECSGETGNITCKAKK